MQDAVPEHNNPKAGQKAIISAVCWVDRGYAKATLEEYQPDANEIAKQKKLGKKLMKGQDPTKGELSEVKNKIEEGLKNKEAEMDGEDSSSDDEPIFTSELARLKAKEKGQKPVNTEVGDEELGEDEEMDVNNDEYPSEYSDSDEEKDDFQVRKSDSLIVAATAENDFSNLEVYIYDHKTSDLYVHHEIILGALPLCLEWLNVWQGEKTNHVIVGTFLPEIEIWNLDSENCEPTAVLGSLEKSEEAKSNKSAIKQFNNEDIGTHTEAVMCLSLNPIQKEYLASGSEDCSVRIWDLDDLQCKAKFNHLHKSKVQCVKWNNVNEQVLLTAGYDSVINILDVRDEKARTKTKLPQAAMDIESANWHPRLEHNFAVSMESGIVLGYDTRKLNEPVFSIQAHQKACPNLSFSPHIPNMMATSSLDGCVKVWDIAANGGLKPQCIGTRHMKQGDLFSMKFSSDIPWVLACGGNTGEIAVWDTCESKEIEDHFRPHLVPGSYNPADYDVNAVHQEADDNEDFESMSDEDKPKKKSDKKIHGKKNKKQSS